jgi:hypothetical protein
VLYSFIVIVTVGITLWIILLKFMKGGENYRSWKIEDKRL